MQFFRPRPRGNPDNTGRRPGIGAQASEGVRAMSKRHMGSGIDDFLKQEGVLEEAQTQAVKEVVAWQLAEAMRKKKISKARMAILLKTSRTQVDRLLNRKDDITLSSLQRAAAMVGRRVGNRSVSDYSSPSQLKKVCRTLNLMLCWSFGEVKTESGGYHQESVFPSKATDFVENKGTGRRTLKTSKRTQRARQSQSMQLVTGWLSAANSRFRGGCRNRPSAALR